VGIREKTWPSIQREGDCRLGAVEKRRAAGKKAFKGKTGEGRVAGVRGRDSEGVEEAVDTGGTSVTPQNKVSREGGSSPQVAIGRGSFEDSGGGEQKRRSSRPLAQYSSGKLPCQGSSREGERA